MKRLIHETKKQLKTLILKNPCNKCLIRACCSKNCETKQNQMHYIYPFIDLKTARRDAIEDLIFIPVIIGLLSLDFYILISIVIDIFLKN